jgi:sarcosine oxidase subunit beta
VRTGSRADAVVVGGGTVGGWCAYFLKRAGLERVVVVEKHKLGDGASSRAAGMVRAQGGTPISVKLGMWTEEFYRSQRQAIGVDSGFVAQGYLMPAFDEAQVKAAKARIAMQVELGLEVSWVDTDEADELCPAMAPGSHLGGSYAPGDGYIDPPRNVAAYTAALLFSGVEVKEHTEFVSLELKEGSSVLEVETSQETYVTERVVLTGGPELKSVGARAGAEVPAGGIHHQVAVTERHKALSPNRVRMVFDLAEGFYWRPEDGGLLFGMSNPAEEPGPARGLDWEYLAVIRRRLAELVPATASLGLRKLWAATMDFSPDHLPILGPARRADGTLLEGVTVASAAGHGMMWGPAVARVAADLCLEAKTDLVDVSSLGLDRFDRAGRSSLSPDPVALPVPERTSI